MAGQRVVNCVRFLMEERAVSLLGGGELEDAATVLLSMWGW